MSTWRGMDAELNELEHKDPKVRAAAEALRRAGDDLARRERHLAARAAVGKRAMPDDCAPPAALVIPVAVQDAIASTISECVALIDGCEEETAHAVVTALRNAGYQITPIPAPVQLEDWHCPGSNQKPVDGNRCPVCGRVRSINTNGVVQKHSKPPTNPREETNE